MDTSGDAINSDRLKVFTEERRAEVEGLLKRGTSARIDGVAVLILGEGDRAVLASLLGVADEVEAIRCEVSQRMPRASRLREPPTQGQIDGLAEKYQPQQPRPSRAERRRRKKK